jgi:hypothetical protein
MAGTAEPVPGTVFGMDLLRRVVDCALERISGPAGARAAILLRHGPSGRMLTRGDTEPVHFPDRATAETFRLRFLDEVDAWEPVGSDAVREAA